MGEHHDYGIRDCHPDQHGHRELGQRLVHRRLERENIAKVKSAVGDRRAEAADDGIAHHQKLHFERIGPLQLQSQLTAGVLQLLVLRSCDDVRIEGDGSEEGGRIHNWKHARTR